MLRLTKRADYGLMALRDLAEHAEHGPRSAKDIADAYHIPSPLLAKVLQVLAKEGLVESHTGASGGYHLARPASEISTFEVVRAIDGPLFITNCVTLQGPCDVAGHCTVKEPLRKVNDSIKDLLSGISIADLIESEEDETASLPPSLVSIRLTAASSR